MLTTRSIRDQSRRFQRNNAFFTRSALHVSKPIDPFFRAMLAVSTDGSSLLAKYNPSVLGACQYEDTTKPLLELLNWDQDISVPNASTDSYVDIQVPRTLSRLNKSVKRHSTASDTRAARYKVRNGRLLEVKSFSCTVPL